MKSLFDELKRRHVFKVVASYGVVAWLLIQIVATVNDPLGLPDWADTLVIVVLATGFPICAFLAWVYDVTSTGIERTDADDAALTASGPRPQGIETWTKVLVASAIAMLIFTTSYIVIDNYRRPIETLAVLPFNNESGDPDTRYLSEGLRDSLITRLSRVPHLRVKSRAATFATDENIQALGRALGVDAVCLGRVLQRGDALEIVAELVSTADGTIIWSERFSRQALSLLAIETEISAEIARQLRFRLSGEQEEELARAPTDNPEAYRLYLQGRYFWNRRREDTLRLAVDYYTRAIELDSGYALAWSGLADAYLMLFAWSLVPPADAAPQVVAAAERAIELDPTLAEPHATLGYYKTLVEWDWEGARREFMRAIELNGNYSTAHHWYAFLLATIGDISAAVGEIELARELEPLSPIINAEVGYFRLLEREYEQGLAELERASTLDPAYPSTVSYLMRANALLGRREEAIAAAERWSPAADGDVVASAYGAMALPSIGLTDDARAIYEEALASSTSMYVMPGLLGVLAAAIGDHDAAFAHFDAALEERSLVVSWLRDPLLDGIRDDPRFAAIFERVGLEL